MHIRSLLFVPGSRPERVLKALGSGADAICIDLEDAVPPMQKNEARAVAFAVLGGMPPGPVRVGVRINDPATAWGEADLAAMPQGRRPDFIMTPKADDASVAGLLGRIGGLPLWPLVETAQGLRDAWAICARPGVEGVLFGAFDYVASLGCEMSWEALLHARSQLAAARALCDIQLLDSPEGDVADDDGLKASSARARALGFTGRACIHPRQVPVVNEVYTPDAAQVAHARRILEAFERDPGAALLDGKLVEAPVALRARRLLQGVREA
jgi:(S)-citramalyl-CoA lyase